MKLTSFVARSLLIVWIAGHTLICDANNDGHKKAGALTTGMQAPAFTLPIIKIDSISSVPKHPKGLKLAETAVLSLESYRGKVVYVDFWASWCKPCVASFPELNRLYTTYKTAGFELIAINMDEHQEEARRFLLSHPVDYPVVKGNDSEIESLYPLVGLPTAYLIDTRGQIRLVHTGFRLNHVSFLEANIEKLLLEKQLLD